MTVASLTSLPRGRRPSAIGAVGALVALALFGIGSTVLDVPTSLSTIGREVRAEQRASPKPDAKQQLNAYGRVPLSFERNEGQTDGRVAFLSRGIGYTLFLSDGGEAVLALSGAARASGDHRPSDPAMPASDPTDAQPRGTSAKGANDLDQGAALRLKIVNANKESQANGRETLPGKVNYLLGQDRAGWRTGVSTFGRVAYDDVYPGVDLVYYGNQRQLEYDFIVRPGADPRVIALEVEGADRLEVDERGDLVVHVGNRQVRQHKPVVYQEIHDVRYKIEGRYVLRGSGRVQFQLGSYDRTQTLVIDPVLDYSTYLGGSGGDFGSGVAVDATGSAYITGFTYSGDYPTTPGAYDQSVASPTSDVFVTKLDAAGAALVYSTYLGGSRDDYGASVAVDATGSAYVTGYTYSSNYPTTPGAYDTALGVDISIDPNVSDVFVTKLDATGAVLAYSTYLGGINNDSGSGIAVDSSGSAYVTGSTSWPSYTTSAGFPTTSGAFDTSSNGGADAFVAKLDVTGTALLYSTYLGGSDTDGGAGIAVDAAGSAYVTGSTRSSDYPTTPGAYDTSVTFPSSDVFVTKLNANGAALLYSTLVGGDLNDGGSAVAVDTTGSAFVVGAAGSNFPTTPGAYDTGWNGDVDGFVSKLDSTGSALIYSSYLGGSQYDSATGVAVDATGNAYIGGTTFSSNFPTTAGAYDTNSNGLYDVFVAKVSVTGASLMYSTYLGGSHFDFGASIAVDTTGSMYVTGNTRSGNFPTTPVGYDVSYNGSGDAFVAKISIPAHVNVDVPPTVDAGANFSVNESQAGVTLHGSGGDANGDALTYAWAQVIDGSPIVALTGANTPTPTFTAPGVAVGGETLTFTLTVTANGESATDSVSVTVVNVNHPPVAEAGPDQSIAEGSPVTLAGGASFDVDTDTFTYSWVQVSGPTVTLAGPNTATPAFTAPYAGSGGGAGVVATLVFKLTVADGYAPDAPAPGYELSNVDDSVTIAITNTNNAPTAAAGADQTVDENAAVALSAAGSTDPDSDSLTFAWVQVGGPPVVLAGAGTATPSFAAPFVSPGGIDVTFRVTTNDGFGGAAVDTVVVHVQNVNDPPLASAARPTIATLWPPNHQMVPVGITGVTDPNNNATITITGVTQDEPTNGLGDGDTAVDAVINPDGTVLLRAERSGTGDGRVYRISFTASDPEGSTTGVVFVTVPHSPKKPAIDSGVVVNSTQ